MRASETIMFSLNLTEFHHHHICFEYYICPCKNCYCKDITDYRYLHTYTCRLTSFRLWDYQFGLKLNYNTTLKRNSQWDTISRKYYGFLLLLGFLLQVIPSGRPAALSPMAVTISVQTASGFSMAGSVMTTGFPATKRKKPFFVIRVKSKNWQTSFRSMG